MEIDSRNNNMGIDSRNNNMQIHLGAGTSLLGLVVAKVGTCITLTNDLDRPEVLKLSKNMRQQHNASSSDAQEIQ
ncbi:hypothetical protein V2J09_020037 [Rumex salicifolius]